MAEKCICCDKKVGLLNGSHLDNQVCDSCYFPIDGYLSAIKQNSDIKIIEDNYNQLIQKVKTSSYSENGKEYIIKLAKNIVKSKKDTIESEHKTEQIRKDFMITTSYNFEDYKINKYFGISSGSTVLGTGIFSELNAVGNDFFGTESDTFSNKLEQARNSSINKMINNAIQQGGNALIGVSFEYVNFSSNMIGVIANGTVVKIIKNDE